MLRTTLLLAALALSGAGGVVRAQSALVASTATVVTPLVVTGTAPLAFGVVFQGIARTIRFNDATSGRISLSGFGNSQVSLTFTLPTTLSNGASAMPINNYRVRANGTNVTAGATRIIVTSGVPVNRNLVSGNLFLFIGGRVQPTAAQAFGSYTAPIVLAAAYTGL
jgi:hypothetical protein